MTTDALLLALLIVSSKLSVPFGPINFTFQILLALIICLTVDAIDSLIIMLTYLIMGLLGLPVFATPTAGISYIYVPSFGFIIGFILMSISMFVIKKNRLAEKNNKYLYFISCLILLAIDYICGFVYAIVMIKVLNLIQIDISVVQILIKFILIFIPFDLIKCILACVVSRRINNSTILE